MFETGVRCLLHGLHGCMVHGVTCGWSLLDCNRATTLLYSLSVVHCMLHCSVADAKMPLLLDLTSSIVAQLESHDC